MALKTKQQKYTGLVYDVESSVEIDTYRRERKRLLTISTKKTEI
jgi:hypothetical protein